MVKTMLPTLTSHFEDDMIVLEKWIPKKPLSAIYWDGDKERLAVKRFLIEQENREDLIITEHPKSYLELISTDWRPMVELEFVKPRGKDPKPNVTINLEEFISIKGIKALGNQLTSDKVKNVNSLEALPYQVEEETPISDIEVVEESQDKKPEIKEQEKNSLEEKEANISSESSDDAADNDIEDDGQITLF